MSSSVCINPVELGNTLYLIPKPILNFATALVTEAHLGKHNKFTMQKADKQMLQEQIVRNLSQQVRGSEKT